MQNETISVCLASFNGELYIQEQIESILSFKEVSELIISDDGSFDKTLSIIKSFDDHRIKIVEGPRSGLINNFQNALVKATGEIIILADQDDVWLSNKIDVIKTSLQKADLVCTDCFVVDENLATKYPSFFELNKSGCGWLKNLWSNSYLGCCMAFRRSVLDHALPLPDKIGMHDWWIGMVAESWYRVVFVYDKTLLFRRHSNNNSNTSKKSKYSLAVRLKWRLNILYNLYKRL